jgi:23S rRNA (cytosine1962-C5)-methyltransferase
MSSNCQSLDTVVLSARAAERLRRGAVHVPRSEVLHARGQGGGDDVVKLSDERGRSLGSALWAEHGPIAARLFDRAERGLSRELLALRIAAADARRKELWSDAGVRPDAYRVVHGEADLLPGLFIDRYADAAVLQTATAAMDARKELLADVLCEVLGVAMVVCRDDGSARDLEALPRVRGVLRGAEKSGTMVRFHDAGSLMEADLLHDRKTGCFLDQQENHAVVAQYAARRFAAGSAPAQALDCFSYHGGFALALLRAGLSVTACDEDGEATLRARRNAALNGIAPASMDFRVANAFELLRSLEAGGARFDVVVLDPPALAKRGRDRSPGHLKDSAWERAYKELNLRGLRLLKKGGLLCTCSCSGRVKAAEFGALIEEAARDVGRPLHLIERRGAGRDHPVLVGWGESEYLKCYLLRALD